MADAGDTAGHGVDHSAGATGAPAGPTAHAAPQVSVVVPTRDRPELLAVALRGICQQQSVPIEILVVDDGSADPAAVDSVVSALTDPRVRILRPQGAAARRSAGVSAARNRGLAAAGGDWVAFCDDDDLWAPTKLASQLAALDRTGHRWAYVGAVDIDRAGAVVKGAAPPSPETVVAELPRANVIPGGCSGVLAARDLLIEVGAFDIRLAPCADWDLWLKLLHAGLPACAPDPLIGYRLHPANMSLDEVRMKADFAVLRARYGTVNEAIFRRYLFWWALRSQRRGAALQHWVAAACARDRSFPASLLGADLDHLLRRSAKAVLMRSRYGRWVLDRRTTPVRAPGPDPYLLAAAAWLAELTPVESAPADAAT
jgi:glycosyltransferase involved in cell wall biosynthesis